MTDGDLIVLPSRSELECASRDSLCSETVFLPEAVFQAAARSLVPSAVLVPSRSAALQHGDPQRFAALRHEIASLHQTGGLDAETASHLLARIILWMADAGLSCRAEQLANGAATALARRAQTYIEEHFHDAIRLEELCAGVGVSLRTLQRCFAAHFQLSPTAYIKARRLNAARRALVAADPQTHSVTQIALASGFSHLGRFSVAYRVYFGESPRQTLVTP